MEEETGRPHLLAAADALIWTSLWLALAISAVTAAAAHAMGVRPDPVILGLAFCGTVVVYVLDRLRDLPRDHRTEPLRCAFVRRHQGGLRILALACAAASLLLGVLAGRPVILLAAAVLGLGLLHRRLKRWTLGKPLYVALSCAAVTVGFTWVHTPAVRHAPWVAGIVAATATANVLLYNLRNADGLTLRCGGRRRTRLLATACLAIACAAALGAPCPVRPLLWLPVAMAVCLVLHRPTERFAAWAVDGALLLGAVLALVTTAA